MTDKILENGDNAPDFTIKDQNENDFVLSSLKGKWIVLYFYPKDNTPGCTTEAIEFSGSKSDLKKKGVEVLGVSPDSVKSHKKFIEMKDLTITLLSDPDKDALKKYGVWQLKKNYGKEYFGVVRSTFIISPDMKIAYSWRSVKVNGHVEAVKTKLDELISGK